MSLHSSLRRSRAAGHRNVLKREERFGKLAEEERWRQEQDSIYGLPKVRSIKPRIKKKAKKTAETAEAVGEAAAGAPAAAAPGAGAPAPAAGAADKGKEARK